MKLKIFAIYDSKSEVFDKPMYAKTTQEMIRDLSYVVNKPNEQNKLYLYPSDFTLFELGEYDDNTGKTECLSTPHALMLLQELKKQDETVND